MLDGIEAIPTMAFTTRPTEAATGEIGDGSNTRDYQLILLRAPVGGLRFIPTTAMDTSTSGKCRWPAVSRSKIRPTSSRERQYRWFLVRAVPLRDEAGRSGMVRNIDGYCRSQTRRERAREAATLEADLAYMNRVMMGELAASLAHEVKQPITAAIILAKACMRWLPRDPPDVAEACVAASGMVEAVTRAAEIIDRVRSLYGRGPPERELVHLNEIVREMTVLLRDTANRRSISSVRK